MFDLGGVFFLQLAKAGIRVAEQEEGTFDLQSLATTGAVAVSKVDLPGAGMVLSVKLASCNLVKLGSRSSEGMYRSKAD